MVLEGAVLAALSLPSWCSEAPGLLHFNLSNLVSEVTLLRAYQSSPVVLVGTVQPPPISLVSFDGVWSHCACYTSISLTGV